MTKEPLSNIARFAFDWAGTLCDPDHGCAPYHRMWPSVRLLESDGALPDGQEFFSSAISDYAQDGGIDVIVSGGADTGVMAMAVTAAEALGLKLRVTAVDRCVTPLEEMRLYGAHSNVSVQTIQTSIEKLPSNLKADLILAHSFIIFISPDLRPEVFKAWATALRPGGAVILSQRLGRRQDEHKTRWTTEAFENRMSKLMEKLDHASFFLRTEEKTKFLKAAEAFWKVAIPTFDVDEDEVRELATLAGLNVKSIAPNSGTAVTTSPFGFSAFLNRPRRYEIVLEKPLD
jgi:SAM-dependent methyltransferase